MPHFFFFFFCASGDSSGGLQKVNPWICVTARRHRGVGGGEEAIAITAERIFVRAKNNLNGYVISLNRWTGRHT